MSGPSLADPGAGGSLVAALSWVQATLLGTVATAVGAIAIAVVGLMMLGGRIDARQGIRTVLGLFILFGAPAIAAGLSASLRGVAEPPPPMLAQAAALPPGPIVPEPLPQALDPYAGVSATSR